MLNDAGAEYECVVGVVMQLFVKRPSHENTSI